MPRLKVVVCVLLLGLLPGLLGAQQAKDFGEMSLEELMNVAIEVASGLAEPISEAPAVVSVITSEQIEAMGATCLSEVLEAVPGLHVSYAQTNFMNPIYAFRGIKTEGNAQVLILIDGIQLTQLQKGGAPEGFRMPVEAIARVEVIRGPGSAVFGADAFAGLINVITKDAEDINGTEFGGRGGSFGTRDAWVQHGGSVGSWDLVLSAEWQQSDGDDGRIIASDLQTILDVAFGGLNASMAPGPLSTHYDLFDTHLKISRDAWSFHVWGQSNEKGLGLGAAPALDPEGYVDYDQTMADLTYSKDYKNNWSFTGRLSYLNLEDSVNLRLFPPGSILLIGADGNINFAEPAGMASFPEGVRANPVHKDTHLMADAFAVYSGSEKHRFRIGVGFGKHELEAEERKNFGPGVLAPPIPSSIGPEMTDVTGTPYIFLEDTDRDHWYVSLQDKWSFTENLEATIGVRYDDYSDFGNTVNPRLALVWNASDAVITKLLYGSAFRAPAFAETSFINNPVGLGNPNVGPEEIDTYEFVVDYRPVDRFRIIFNLFKSDIQGLIDLEPIPGTSMLTYGNVRNQDAQGAELELFWDITNTVRIHGSYSFQDSEDEYGATIANVPENMMYLSALWRPGSDWSIFAQAKWISDRVRPSGDLRPLIDDYKLVNLTIRRKNIARHLDLAFIVRNIFDDDAFEPSAGPEIPLDIPLAGRSVLGELVLHF